MEKEVYLRASTHKGMKGIPHMQPALTRHNRNRQHVCLAAALGIGTAARGSLALATLCVTAFQPSQTRGIIQQGPQSKPWWRRQPLCALPAASPSTTCSALLEGLPAQTQPNQAVPHRTFVLRGELPHGQGQRLVEAQLL